MNNVALKVLFLMLAGYLWWTARAAGLNWSITLFATLVGCYQLGRADAYAAVARMLRSRL